MGKREFHPASSVPWRVPRPAVPTRGWRAWLIGLVVLLLAGCQGRFDAEDPAPFVPSVPELDVGVDVSSQVVVEHPLFGGITSMVAGDGTVTFQWDPASDDVDPADELAYRLYLAAVSGDYDFTSPAVVTAPGATSAAIGSLTNGEAVYAIVRAVDRDGNEDPNDVEWLAVPNPVRYVSAGASGPSDGLTPQSAYSTILQAISASVGAGVNIYVAQGGYSENLFLFPGMSLYAGFRADFAERDPTTFVTEVFTPFSVDVVQILPGVVPVVLDGAVLSGNRTAVSGVLAEDIELRITNVEVRDVLNQGIELRSHADDDGWIRGLIGRCTIARAGGEGILLSGTPDLRIDNNRIRDSANEGIESQWIFAQAGERARLDITRNRIENSGDEGIDLDVAEISEIDPTASADGRVRIAIRNNEIVGSRLSGIQIDVDFENGDDIDLRVRIDDNAIRDNLADGVLFDGDAAAYLRIARNVISANRGAGVRLLGTSDGPWVRISHDRVLGNRLGGVVVDGLLGVEVRHTLLRANGGPAIVAPRAYVDVVNSLILDHGLAFDATRLRHTLLRGDVAPVPGPGNLTGDPGLENEALALSFTAGQSVGDLVVVSQAQDWSVGDTLEVADDGTARRVVAVGGGTLAVDPDPGAVTSGTLVARFSASQDVREREGLLVGSPAIDAGDSLERDRDGTVADLGPVGGATPGNVGVETALGPDERLELVRVQPAPGFLVTEGFWRVGFNRVLTPDAADRVRVLVNGSVHDASVIVVDDELRIGLVSLSPQNGPRLIHAGDPLTLEFVPRPDATDEEIQEHLLLDYTGADAFVDADSSPVDVNGTPAAAQALANLPALGTGSIGNPGDVDVYRLTLMAGQTLRVEVIAGRDESPLVARAVLLASDGATVLASGTAAPPNDVDPFLPAYTAPNRQDVFVQVNSVVAAGSVDHTYRLALFVD
ncbi:MAG: right-handed parallel beta-helix repeat-containing protein [Planctomycetota bacterium]